MSTRVFPFDWVCRWLASACLDTARRLISGCGFDDGISEADWRVTDVGGDGVSLACARYGARREFRCGAHPDARLFVDPENAELIAVLDAAQPPMVARLVRLRALLARYAIPPDDLRSADDVRTAHAFLSALDRGQRPPVVVDAGFFEVLKAHALFGPGARIYERLRELVEPVDGPFDPWARIKLCVLLRHGGDIDGALRISDALLQRAPRFAPTKPQRAALSTERAAALLDRFERDGDVEDLKQARYWLNWAWAAEQSAETGAAYRRLDELEKREDGTVTPRSG